MGRWRIYRVLSVILALSVLAALRERSQPASAVPQAQARATGILLALYPDFPKHLYFRGRDALNAGDLVGARRLFEAALEKRLYSNEGLLHEYALVLIELGAPRAEIERATALWRKHFPHSHNPDPMTYLDDPAPAR